MQFRYNEILQLIATDLRRKSNERRFEFFFVQSVHQHVYGVEGFTRTGGAHQEALVAVSNVHVQKSHVPETRDIRIVLDEYQILRSVKLFKFALGEFLKYF